MLSAYGLRRWWPGGRGARVRTLLAAALAVVAGHGQWVSPAHADGRRAAIVIDANTGEVLHANAADGRRYPASLAKMMTLYLTFEMMEQSRLNPKSPIRVSETAAAAPPSRLGLEAGSTISLEDAIRALVVKSANDISVAIAEAIAGSEEAFARLMTRRARELGMKATRFTNAHGLPDPEQTTTARDMATLSLALYDHFPHHSRVFASRSFAYAGARYRNHNTMLGSFEGLEGIKTGYIRASGFNLAASVRRDGRHVVAVVMGGSSAAARNAEMRVLLTRALRRASTTSTRRPIARPATAVAGRPTAAPTAQPRTQAAAPAQRPPSPQPIAARETAQPAREEPARPQLAEAPRQVLSDAPRRTPSAPAAAPPGNPPIIMTRVRPVPVVNPPRGRQPSSDPPQPAAAPRAEPPLPASDPSPVRPPQRVQPLAETPAPRPAPAPAPVLPHHVTMPPPPQPASPPAAVAAPAGRVVRPPYGLAGPANAPVPAGTHAIQIGAFSSPAEAERRLVEVHRMAPGALAAAVPRTETIDQGGRQLYRARFAGFDGKRATQACLELRRQRVDCFVTKD